MKKPSCKVPFSQYHYSDWEITPTLFRLKVLEAQSTDNKMADLLVIKNNGFTLKNPRPQQQKSYFAHESQIRKRSGAINHILLGV